VVILSAVEAADSDLISRLNTILPCLAISQRAIELRNLALSVVKARGP